VSVGPGDREVPRALLRDRSGSRIPFHASHDTAAAAPFLASLRAMDSNAIAILGGTGDQGLGLALRFAKAGRPVVIGSRKLDRAVTAADEVRAAVPGANVEGLENADATRKAPIVILSVPFEHTASTVKGIRESLAPEQVVVSMGVPLAAAIGDGAVRTLGVWQGSCAELVESLVPAGVAVVSAFQNVSAVKLARLDQPIGCDVLVVGDAAEAKQVAVHLAQVMGAAAYDAGGLDNAIAVEGLTAILIGINIRYKVKGAGVRITGFDA